ncbi:MAG: hypothetical protein IJ308_08480 [Clostridia bacterium]|nr:hypothetical protein [Clostridia bacterium]
MKIIGKNGKIYLQADFKNLTNLEHNFMRDLSYKGIWFGKFDEWGDAPLVEFESITPPQLKVRYKRIVYDAKVKGVEIADTAQAIFDNQEQLVKIWEQEQEKFYEHEKHVKQLKKSVERAYDVRENGCRDCINLYLDRDNGKYMCRFTDKPCYKKSDEAELEFYAQREARILRADNWYWARPFPVPGCEVLLNGRQAELELQEIKEKEGN